MLCIKVYVNNKRVSPCEINRYKDNGIDFIFNDSTVFPKLEDTGYDIRLDCFEKYIFKGRCIKCKRLNNQKGYRFIFKDNLEVLYGKSKTD